MSSPFQTGQVLAERYTVERSLGQGGMASVYAVRHVALGSRHALKVLDMPGADVRERLLQEGRIQASLRHPGIVSVTDTLEIDGQPALVMEYVDGPTLADVLARRRPTLEEAERWFRLILGAVRYAHERGLVHRDLKPDNVLMAELPDGPHPKVADFGIAKVVSEWSAGREGKTRGGMSMGTPAYMAPEQIESARDVDARADVFALGCILYEMVCGRRAFEGENLLSVLSAAVAGRYVPPKDLVPDLPPRIVAAIQGALRPKPEDRIPSCAELTAILDGDRDVTGAHPPVPTAVRIAPEPAPSRGGGGVLLLVGALLAMALIAGVAVMAVFGLAGAGVVVWAGTRAPVDTGRMTAPPAIEVHERVPQNTAPLPKTIRVEVKGWRTAQRLKNGVFTHEPDTGNVLILADAVLENLTDEEIDLSFPWDVLDAEGEEYSADLGCSMAIARAIPPFDDLGPRQRFEGELCFEVPRDAKGLRVRFDSELESDPAAIFPL